MDSNHDGDLQMLTADQLKDEVMMLRQSLKASESRRDGVPARKGDELRQLVYQLRQELKATQAAPAPIPVYTEHAEKPVSCIADEQPAPEGMMSEDVREAMHVMLIAWRYYHGETTSYKIARDWLDQQRPATTAGKEEQHCE